MVGVSTTHFWGYKVTEALELSATMGYQGVEVWAEHMWLHGDSEQEVRYTAQALGLHLTVHSASWDLNLTARNEAIRKASLQQVIRSIELASRIDASMITVHPGRTTLHGKDLEWHWERQAEAFRILAERGAELGVLINVEMMEPISKEFCTEPEHINRLLAAVNHPNLGVTFDIAHLPLHRDPARELQMLTRVDEIHISDSTATKLHVPLEKGEINFIPVLQLVAARGLSVMIEGYEARRSTELAAWNKQSFDRLWALASSRNAVLEAHLDHNSQ